MIIYKGDKAIIDGIVFCKDKRTGYYLSNIIYGRKRIRLHRYIWEKYNGAIPKGYDVHHIDKNKDNNNIENLQLLTVHEHQMIHAVKSEEEKERSRKQLDKVRHLASAWHKSENGRKWHSKHSKQIIQDMQLKQYYCLNCGKEFLKKPLGLNKFCSNKCKSAYRRKLGLDDVDRKCIICGNYFKVNKYAKKLKCNKCQRNKNKVD